MTRTRLKRIEEKLNHRRGEPGVFFLEKTADGFILYGKDPQGQLFDSEKAAVQYFDTVTLDHPNSILIFDDLL